MLRRDFVKRIISIFLLPYAFSEIKLSKTYYESGWILKDQDF